MCAFRGLRPLWPHPLAGIKAPFPPSRFQAARCTRGGTTTVGTFSYLNFIIDKSSSPRTAATSLSIPLRFCRILERFRCSSSHLSFPYVEGNFSIARGGGYALPSCAIWKYGVSLSSKSKYSFVSRDDKAKIRDTYIYFSADLIILDRRRGRKIFHRPPWWSAHEESLDSIENSSPGPPSRPLNYLRLLVNYACRTGVIDEIVS